MNKENNKTISMAYHHQTAINGTCIFQHAYLYIYQMIRTRRTIQQFDMSAGVKFFHMPITSEQDIKRGVWATTTHIYMYK